VGIARERDEALDHAPGQPAFGGEVGRERDREAEDGDARPPRVMIRTRHSVL